MLLLYILFQGIPFETIVSKSSEPPQVKDMEEEIQNKNSIFMIKVSLVNIKLILYLLK